MPSGSRLPVSPAASGLQSSRVRRHRTARAGATRLFRPIPGFPLYYINEKGAIRKRLASARWLFLPRNGKRHKISVPRLLLRLFGVDTYRHNRGESVPQHKLFERDIPTIRYSSESSRTLG